MRKMGFQPTVTLFLQCVRKAAPGGSGAENTYLGIASSHVDQSSSALPAERRLASCLKLTPYATKSAKSGLVHRSELMRAGCNVLLDDLTDLIGAGLGEAVDKPCAHEPRSRDSTNRCVSWINNGDAA
jgi:hypothetical protein